MSGNRGNEKLPEGWKRVRLGEVADINMGQSPPSIVVNERELGIPFLQGNAEFTSKYPIPQKWITKPLKLSKKGDVLISVRAPVGAVNKADRDYCIGRGLAAISFRAIDDRFGWFEITFWKYQLENLSQGSTFGAISRDDLKNLLFILPTSLPEQHKIAEVLETVDNAIEKTDKIIEKYKRIKQGLMQDLLTKGIDENGQIRSEETHRFKDSELGRIPEEWEVVELGKVGIEFIDGDRGVNYPHQGELLKDGYCLFLNNKNIESGKFVFNEAQYISKEKDSALGSGRLKFGDIVITTRGTVGNMAFFNYQNLIVRINSGMIILRNYQHIFDPYFFIYLWLFSLPKKLRILGSGSAQPQLPLRDLRKFKFVSSPLSEQHRIAQILSQIDETIEKEQKYKEKLERIKQGLMQDLLTGKVRVNSLIEEVKNEADCKSVLLRHCEPAKGRRSNLKRKINV